MDVHPAAEVLLGALTQFKVLHGHLAHEVEVRLEPGRVFGEFVVVVELHARDLRVRGRTDAEGTHATTVEVEGADGEEEEEEPVVGPRVVVREGEMARVVAVVVHLVARRRVEHREGPVRVLTVQTLLVAVHHGLPVELPRVREAAAVGESGEIIFGEKIDEGSGKENVKRWSGGRQGGEE